MSYPIDESFDTGIPAGFATNGGGGSVAATWNAANQAVDLVFPASQTFWRITAAEQASDFWIEMDVEVVAATGVPHFGFWLWTGVGSYEGHRIAIINYFWAHSFWSSGGSESEQRVNGYAGWAVVGGRKTVRLDAKLSAAGLWHYRLLVDGEVVWQEAKRWYSTFLPGVFGHGTTLRLHRFSGASPSALDDAPVLAQRLLSPRVAKRVLVADHAAALVFKHRGLQLLAGTRNHYHHGGARITGTVKEKGVAVDVPVKRRVLLFDERANVVVRETWSDAATGAYAFESLNPTIRYLVIAYDHQQNFRATVADNLTAEPMP
jgi:hypothetical protein